MTLKDELRTLLRTELFTYAKGGDLNGKTLLGVDAEGFLAEATERIMVEIVDQASSIFIGEGTIKVTPAANPRAVAEAALRRIVTADLPSGSVTPSGISPEAPRPPQPGRDGKVTERDRFLDDANDRRCALSAAARAMSGAEYDGYEELIDLSRRLYASLREGKS